MDYQNMCEVAEYNGVQILNVVQFIVESSTYFEDKSESSLSDKLLPLSDDL